MLDFNENLKNVLQTFNLEYIYNLSTWNVAKTYMTDSIVCVFILSYFECLGLLYSVAQVGNYSLIFRDAG